MRPWDGDMFFLLEFRPENAVALFPKGNCVILKTQPHFWNASAKLSRRWTLDAIMMRLWHVSLLAAFGPENKVAPSLWKCMNFNILIIFMESIWTLHAILRRWHVLILLETRQENTVAPLFVWRKWMNFGKPTTFLESLSKTEREMNFTRNSEAVTCFPSPWIPSANTAYSLRKLFNFKRLTTFPESLCKIQQEMTFTCNLRWGDMFSLFLNSVRKARHLFRVNGLILKG